VSVDNEEKLHCIHIENFFMMSVCSVVGFQDDLDLCER